MKITHGKCEGNVAAMSHKNVQADDDEEDISKKSIPSPLRMLRVLCWLIFWLQHHHDAAFSFNDNGQKQRTRILVRRVSISLKFRFAVTYFPEIHIHYNTPELLIS